MAQPPRKLRIKTENFDSKYKDLISQISYTFNEFMDQVIFVLDRKVDFRNLNQQIIDITIKTDGFGDAINPPTINSSNIQGKVIGVYSIAAVNNDNSSVIPIAQPFIQFTIKTGQVIILNVSGLQVSSEYSLKLLLIGENVG